MQEYNEPYESIQLQYLNSELIAQHNSIIFQTGLKIAMCREALRKGDWSFFLRQLKSKVYRKSYYSSEGNEKFSNMVEVKTYESLPRAVVYTCIVGNYDKILEPLFVNDSIDYIIFTDQELDEGTVWKKIDLREFPEYKELDPITLNRKIKLCPFDYLPNYDYSLYIDGNIQIVSDMMPLFLGMNDSVLGVHTHAIRDCIYKEANGVKLLNKANPQKVKLQLQGYKKDGFPENFGLFQNSILIRNHRSQECIQLMKMWWEEYEASFTRDQLSLPYVIWKSQLSPKKICVLGRNAYNNSRFRIIEHL